jgi:hypothetical protein
MPEHLQIPVEVLGDFDLRPRGVVLEQAPQRRDRPAKPRRTAFRPARRERNPLVVERADDRFHAAPGDVVAKHAPHDVGLAFVDLESRRHGPFPGPRLLGYRHGAIAKDPAACAESASHPARESAVGLVPQVVEVALVDESFDGEVHLRALGSGGDPVAHPDQVDASEPKAMVDIARQPRQILDEDHVERLGRRERGRQELLIAQPVLDAEPRERGVLGAPPRSS